MRLRELVASEREQMRTGHYAYLIIAASCAVFITDDILGDPDRGWWLALHTAVNLLTILWFWLLYCQLMVHDRQPCPRCAASMPLDPQAAVSRWRPALKLQHGKAPKVLLALLLLWIVTTLFLVSGKPYWSLLVQAGFQAAILVLVVIGHQHARLQPWCPWCHWDDGGEVSPDVPDPAVSR